MNKEKTNPIFVNRLIAAIAAMPTGVINGSTNIGAIPADNQAISVSVVQA